MHVIEVIDVVLEPLHAVLAHKVNGSVEASVKVCVISLLVPGHLTARESFIFTTQADYIST